LARSLLLAKKLRARKSCSLFGFRRVGSGDDKSLLRRGINRSVRDDFLLV
jgi:hypothetical protein